MSFYAQYESDCDLCGGTIYEGEEAAFDSDASGAVHSDCADEARNERLADLHSMIDETVRGGS